MKPRARISGSTGRRAHLTLLYAAALLPAAAWLEQLFRSTAAVLVIRHQVLELLTVLSLLFGAVAFSALPWLVAGWALWRWRQRKPPGWVDLARFGLRVGLVVGSAFALAFWWWLAAWQPPASTLFGLALFVATWRLGRTWRERYAILLAAGAGAAVFLAASFMLEHRASIRIEQERIFTRAAYDASPLSETEFMVLSAADGAAFVGQGDTWSPVPLTAGPQRMIVGAGGTAYVTNFNARWRHALTRWTAAEQTPVALPGCSKAIDIAGAPGGRLVVACEFSGTVHLYDPARQIVEKTFRVPRLPYALAVDPEKNGVFVTSENVSGRVTSLDLFAGRQLVSRSLGWVNWGVAFDLDHRRLFVARPLSGEVTVLDENLRVTARLPVGAAPRELAIDPHRRTLLVTHYFSGTITEIDLDGLRILRRFSVGPAGPWHQLRGIHVTAEDSWLASDTHGVWRLKP
jgi:hypothetical protein